MRLLLACLTLTACAHPCLTLSTFRDETYVSMPGSDRCIRLYQEGKLNP